MRTKTPLRRVLFRRCPKLLLLGVFIMFSSLLPILAPKFTPHANAATSSTINFQARLLGTAGSMAPDGYYNIEFKLYNASTSSGSSQGSCTGDSNCLWTETRYDSNGVTAGNDNRVRVANGYLTVNLGSITSFPSTINWDQELWLTMNVGGTTQTATPTWDGEMSPRLKLTAVPYAFKAGQLAKYNSGTGYNSTLELQNATGGNQIFQIPDQGAAGTYTLLTTNTANTSFIQNTTTVQANANIAIQSASTSAHTLLIKQLTSQSGDYLRLVNFNNDLIFNIDTNGNADLNGQFQANYLSAGVTAESTIRLYLATGADGTNGIVINTTGAGQTANAIQINDNSLNAIGGFGPQGGIFSGRASTFTGNLKLYNSTNANTVTLQSGATSTSYTLTLPTAVGASGDCLKTSNGTGALTFGSCGGAGSGVTTVGTIDSQTKSADGAVISGTSIYMQTADASNPGLVSTGTQTFAGSKTFTGNSTLFKPGTNSTTAFQIQPSASSTSVFNVDTTNSRVGIGNNAPSYPLDVTGDINTSTQYRIGGTVVCTSSGCTPAAGSSNYIQNTTTLQTNASLAIQSAADGNITAFFQGRTNQTADTLRIKLGSSQAGDYIRLVDSADTNVFRIDTFGNLHQVGNARVDGFMGVGIGASSGVRLRVEAASAGNVGLEVIGSGSDNVVQFSGSNGRSLVHNAAGTLALTTGTNQTADGQTITLNNNTGTITNGLNVNRSTSGGTTTNGINITQTAGTLTNGLSFTGTIGTDINRGSGTLSINGAGGINLQTNGTTTASLSATGAALFKNSTNSTTAFQVQNSSSDSLLTVDTSGNNLYLLGNNSPTLSTWTTTTAMSVGSNTNRARGGAVVANGYLYHIGGVDGAGTTLDTVQYAKLNADGTVGTWASTTALPDARRQFQPVVVNGYLYIIGGRDNSSTTESTTYYAKLNADGTVGSWNTTTALTEARFNQGTVAYNGYIYVMGGYNGSVVDQSTVYVAKANPDGTVGSWSTTTALPTTLVTINGAVVANGYVYLAGGWDGTGYEDDIVYAKLNTDGTVGSWTTLTDVLNASGGGDENYQTFVANGYLYVVGGDLNNRVVAFPLNSNGGLGSGTILTDFPLDPVGEAAGASANGYFYILGGSSSSDGGGTVRNTVYVASTSRVKVGANLDLVGYSGENLTEGGSGGQLTAGNTAIIGTLQVQDSANFTRAVTIGGTLHVGGAAVFRNDANSTTAFQIQNSSGNQSLTVDTSNNQVILGKASTLQGKLVFANSAGSNTVTLAAPASNPGSSFTLTIPTALGSSGDCLKQNDGTGTLAFGSCAAGSGVTTVGAIDTQTKSANGAVISGTSIYMQTADASNPGLVSTGTQTFAGDKTLTGKTTLSRNGTGTGDHSFGVTGTPINDASSSLIRIGNAIAGGNNSADGGTYIGINQPSTGAGSAADYLNFQNNGTSQFKVTNGGNVTASGTYNTNTFTGSALTFGSASTATIQSASSQALTITANAASTWSTGSGDLSIQSASALNLGNGGGTTINIGTNNAAHTIQIGNTGVTGTQAITMGGSGNTANTVTIEAGTGASAIQIGNGATAHGIQIGTGAAVQTIVIGSTNSSSSTTIQGGTGNITLNTNSASAKIIAKSSTNSSSAFEVQNSSGAAVLSVDTSGSQTLFGVAGSMNAKLVLNNATNSNTLTIQSGTTSSSYTLTLPTAVGSSGDCLKAANGTGTLTFGTCAATGATRKIYLVPEYPGGVLFGDGTSNTGTLTSDFDSTNRHNYYNWTATSGSLQDYDVVMRAQIPSEYASNFGTFKIWVYAASTSTANNDIQVTVKDNSGTTCANGTSVLPGSATTWTEQSVTLSGCTFAANDLVTISVKVLSKSSNAVRIGEISYQYTN